MFDSSTIDLFDSRFWVAVAIACAVMTPLVGGTARKIAFALLNVAFLGIYLGANVLAVLVGVLLAHISLKVLEDGRFVRAMAALGGGLVLALFLMHKLPWMSKSMGLRGWNPVMVTIGFSYVALRLVEVGRAVAEKRHPAPGLCATINYLLPFHMLAAGPIQAYDEFVAQPATPPALGFADSLRAAERIVFGLFKKFVVAKLIKDLFLTDFRSHGLYFFLEMQLNYLWLYLDFSAYTDIAVGIGRLLGVATPENFNRPYLARNSIDYWERWHISLSQFIRRNLFIPIQLSLMRRSGGSRPLLIASVAFTISFLLCGLWHEVQLRWLAWGAYQALGLVICNAYRSYLLTTRGRKGLNQYLANPWIRVAAMIVTYEFIALSLVIVTARWSLY
jgi:D-alanyl-lipoteichoic acid acyltransferase DltB (MBOAT superfamily)